MNMGKPEIDAPNIYPPSQIQVGTNTFLSWLSIGPLMDPAALKIIKQLREKAAKRKRRPPRVSTWTQRERYRDDIIESYNVDEPPRLPFTHDPRIDLLVEYNGLWYWPDNLPTGAPAEAP